MRKYLVTLIFASSLCYSQSDQESYFSFSFYQDFNLAFFEDENGLTPFTFNPTVKYTWGITDKDINLGYFLFSAVYTFADLSDEFLGDFHRWGIETGFALRETNWELWSKKKRLLNIQAEAALLLGYGVLIRQLDPGGIGSFELSGQLSFKIYKNLRFNLLGSLLESPDLPDKTFRFNGAIGLEYRIVPKIYRNTRN